MLKLTRLNNLMRRSEATSTEGDDGVASTLRRRIGCRTLLPAPSPLRLRLWGRRGVRVWAAGADRREARAGRLRSRRGAGVIELT